MSQPAPAQKLAKPGRKAKATRVPVPSFRCFECGKGFDSRGELKRHEETCDGPGDPDPEPPRSDSSPSIEARKPDNRVVCDACDEKFPDARAMGIHKTRVHFGR